MATLVDHKRRTRTPGKPETLIALMVEAQVSAYRRIGFKPVRLRQAAESRVRGCIRLDLPTDANQRLVLDPYEREDWEAANPLPE